MSKPSEFLKAIEDDKLVAAIHRAEAKSKATFRVHVSHQSSFDPIAAARRAFHHQRDHQNHHHHGRILIFVAPQSQAFALLGDSAAHAAVGGDGWQSVTDQLAAHFRNSDFTGGLVEVLEKIADRIEKAHAGGDST